MAHAYGTSVVKDFGGPVVQVLPSNAGGVGSIPDQGAKIPHQKTKTETIL